MDNMENVSQRRLLSFFSLFSMANSYLMHDIWASVCSWVVLKISANLSLVVLIKLGPYKKNLEINLCNSSEHLITLSFAKIVCNIPVNNAWSECGGSTLKRIKQKSPLKTVPLIALLIISINYPNPWRPTLSGFIKPLSWNAHKKSRWKSPVVNQKEIEIQIITVKIQNRLYSESESSLEAEGYLTV